MLQVNKNPLFVYDNTGARFVTVVMSLLISDARHRAGVFREGKYPTGLTAFEQPQRVTPVFATALLILNKVVNTLAFCKEE